MNPESEPLPQEEQTEQEAPLKGLSIQEYFANTNTIVPVSDDKAYVVRPNTPSRRLGTTTQERYGY